MTAAVILDIVGSRRLADRAAAQRVLDEAIARLGIDGPPPATALHPIVGDEFQGVYATVGEALIAVLLLRLALPDGIDCRFGIGLGEVGVIPSAAGAVSDGSAWWAARDAIDIVHGKQQRAVPGLRTWALAADDEEPATRAAVPLVNAYLLARDQLVSEMGERTRRLVHGRCLGATQSELAAAEGITQSAVSQALRSSGAAAVVEGFALLAGEVSGSRG